MVFLLVRTRARGCRLGYMIYAPQLYEPSSTLHFGVKEIKILKINIYECGRFPRSKWYLRIEILVAIDFFSQV
jgi:hypothetical protein